MVKQRIGKAKSFLAPYTSARRRWILICALLALASIAAGGLVWADSNAFDLSGPPIDMRVTRGTRTLPISRTANLQPGDRLWIHPDLPESQSVHYLLVIAFLRGSTNPPPEAWFTKVETWTKPAREEGIVVTVPQDAQQALLFLAPETGGDFNTLRNAVRGRPGAFVRASQDLNQASFDRSRLETYLNDVKAASNTDPTELHERSVLLARTLNIKLDQQCFDKPSEQQAPCLTQGTDQMILDDGHSQTMVTALTSGPSSDLIGNASSTPLAGGGFYSAYVGAVVDMVRILDNIHTALYQYIPALALPKNDQLNLKLNNPPSFRNPKSVIVVGLPPVESPQLPPLRPVDPKQILCLEKSPLVLPTEGAPLVFSTDLAHDFVLHLEDKSGNKLDLPAKAEAERGGFVIDTHALATANLAAEATGTLRGQWGFEAFDGPRFSLRSAHSGVWTISPADKGALIVGRDDVLHVNSECAPCAEEIKMKDHSGKDLRATWKLAKPDELEVKVPLKDETAGAVTLEIKQFGLKAADELPLAAYSEAAHLDRFTINAGDKQGVLDGTRLDEVASFEMKGVRFVPAKLSRVQQKDELGLAIANPAPAESFQPEEKVTAHVALKDGRVLDLQTTVEAPRPKVTLVSKTVQPGPTPSAVRLGSQEELPLDGRLSFFVKSEVPEKFPRTEKIEVATVDGAFDVLLSVADGNLILQDASSVLAVLDPLKSFGSSAFGPLQLRPVDADGAKGDWQPLVMLVRLPSLKDIRCPDSADKQCTLNGTNLFLLDSVASDAEFTHVVSVPVGYVDTTLRVPRPNGTLLYIKLRDDPSKASTVVLPVLPQD
ncbi:MAG: hypothetical protein WCA38_01145 [Candidatus Acidiferrales bacterium]